MVTLYYAVYGKKTKYLGEGETLTEAIKDAERNDRIIFIDELCNATDYEKELHVLSSNYVIEKT